MSVNFSVNFATKDLLGTGNSQASDFFTQLFAQTFGFLSHFSLSSFDDTIGFNLGLGFCFFNNSLTALFAVIHDRQSLSTGFSLNRLTFLLGFR